MTRAEFNVNSNLVIDKLEGGYYHPDMLADGRVKDSRYGSSGETMFGIDRKYLGNPANGSAQQKFWSVIDNANARKMWQHNYFGGTLEPVLRQYAADIIYPEYSKYSSRYLNPKAQQTVDSDNRLAFNFIYSVWNGEGWFKKFAESLNNAVNNGITNKDQLVDVVVNRRISDASSLISQGGEKIKSFIQYISTKTTQTIDLAKRHKALAAIIVASSIIAIVGIAFIVFKRPTAKS